MDTNIVEQVSAVEAEADRIVEKARADAAGADAELPRRIEALRKQNADDVKHRLEALREKLDASTRRRIAEIESNARKAMDALESLDPEAVEQAVRDIAARLREDA